MIYVFTTTVHHGQNPGLTITGGNVQKGKIVSAPVEPMLQFLSQARPHGINSLALPRHIDGRQF